jgi:hypothetical protein
MIRPGCHTARCLAGVGCPAGAVCPANALLVHMQCNVLGVVGHPYNGSGLVVSLGLKQAKQRAHTRGGVSTLFGSWLPLGFFGGVRA